MKNYDKNKESLYIQYLDANNLYGGAMPQKMPVDRKNGTKWNKKWNEKKIGKKWKKKIIKI